MFEVNIYLERKRREGKITLTASSFKWESPSDRWGNCLYLSFIAEEFPQFKRPKLVDGWAKGIKRFQYEESDANCLDWHGGCTFYEELIVVETGRTLIKMGCDYSHYLDDDYMARDSGEEILFIDGPKVLKEFLDLIDLRKSQECLK